MLWVQPLKRQKKKKKKKIWKLEFPYGTAGKGSGIVTARDQVAAVVWVRALAWELPYAMGAAKQEKKKNLEPARGLTLSSPASTITAASPLQSCN